MPPVTHAAAFSLIISKTLRSEHASIVVIVIDDDTAAEVEPAVPIRLELEPLNDHAKSVEYISLCINSMR